MLNSPSGIENQNRAINSKPLFHPLDAVEALRSSGWDFVSQAHGRTRPGLEGTQRRPLAVSRRAEFYLVREVCV
jgi:hypothetical protein